MSTDPEFLSGGGCYIYSSPTDSTQGRGVLKQRQKHKLLWGCYSVLLFFHSALLSYPRARSKITANSKAHTLTLYTWACAHTPRHTNTAVQETPAWCWRHERAFSTLCKWWHTTLYSTFLYVIHHYSWKGWLGFDRLVHVDPQGASLEVDLGEICTREGLHDVFKCVRQTQIRCSSYTRYHLVAKQRITPSQNMRAGTL